MRGARRTLLALCITLAASLALPAAASAVTQTFTFTGAAQAFTVPTGVTQITVEALGAQGGQAQDGTAGGLGGRAIATIAVTPGEVLQVNVGGQPSTGNPAPGGFNGGGASGTGGANSGGGGGGGASDVRQGGTGFATRVVIAGGGGGGGNITNPSCTGGTGGGTAGGAGSPCSTSQQGLGGTQSLGGAGGTGGQSPGSPGAIGTGGAGGAGTHSGGGGGGGRFGGGGGAGGGSIFDGGGGGGGSGFTPNGTGMTNGVRSGHGQVALTYTVTPTLTTNASGNVAIGRQVNDTATLADGASPTGQITFRLFGPDDSNCSGAPVFTDSQTVSGNGAYQSASFTPTAAGTYRWIASYSGDADNIAVAGACNDPNESVTVGAPVLGQSLLAGPVKGTVLIREPGASGFNELTGSELIPLGSSVDTTDGRVGITSATRDGGTQRTEFYDGEFDVDQTGSGVVRAELEGAKFGSCKNRSERAPRASKKLARLWGSGKGRARSRGRRGSGTVRGTIWLTEERCNGTFFKVRKGKVKVRDFERKKNVTLRRGDSYLAKG